MHLHSEMKFKFISMSLKARKQLLQVRQKWTFDSAWERRQPKTIFAQVIFTFGSLAVDLCLKCTSRFIFTTSSIEFTKFVAEFSCQ